MNGSFQTFGVIGAGAWGTALAMTLRRAGRDVVLWSRNPPLADAINKDHVNAAYLPGIALNMDIRATARLHDMSDCDAWILATPAQALRAAAKQLAALAAGPRPIVIAAKGIELATGRLLSDVAAGELKGHPSAILSGPSFAEEVAKGQPTALCLAACDLKLGEDLRHAMHSPAFRLYLTEDIVGAQLGGALKNVLAIACGIVTGRRMGDNARAALITRGLAEIMRLGAALGGRPETLMGLAGLGDLILTCSSPQSRNMSLGIGLGEGRRLEDILGARVGVTEGVATTAAALALARPLGVDMPLVAAVDAVINRHADIDSIISNLLARPLRGAEG